MRLRCVLSIALKLLMRVRKKFVRALIEISVAIFGILLRVARNSLAELS
jgi:hypothetical protein